MRKAGQPDLFAPAPDTAADTIDASGTTATIADPHGLSRHGVKAARAVLEHFRAASR